MKLVILANVACFSILRGLGSTDLLGLLAIVIALSAYLATIRQYFIETSRNKKGEDLARTRTALHLLFWADMPMTVSAVLIGLYALFNWPSSWVWVLWCGEIIFVLAGLLLFGYHGYGWCLTWKRHKKAHYLPISLNASTCTDWKRAFDAGKSKHKTELGRVVWEEETGETNKEWILTELKVKNKENIDEAVKNMREFLDDMNDANRKAGLEEHFLAERMKGER